LENQVIKCVKEAADDQDWLKNTENTSLGYLLFKDGISLNRFYEILRNDLKLVEGRTHDKRSWKGIKKLDHRNIFEV
jgi:hypothetical protein